MPWRDSAFCRYRRVRHDDAGVVSRLDPLPCLAEDAREICSAVFDHAAIFFLIAGTYTPFTLRSFGEVWGATLFALVWALAIFGALLKITRGPSRHPKLAMSLYLGTGWLGLVVFRPMSLAIPPSAVFWLLAGGIAYTAGVLFFVMERLRYGHFVWHLFVVAGTTCHFLAIFACCAV